MRAFSASAGSKESGGEKEIYDEIVEEYSAIKSNPYKTFVEEPTFFAMLGDVSGKSVLDLACGSGHFSRQIRARGASLVVGVDVSSEMIAEAQRIEADGGGKKGGGQGGTLVYCAADATAGGSYMPLFQQHSPEPQARFDIVTAQYLFPYASTLSALQDMCEAAHAALKPGGALYCVTTCFDPAAPPPRASTALGYRMSWDGAENGDPLSDGSLVQLTLVGGGGFEVTFPNVLWSRPTLEAALLGAGFDNVTWVPEQVSAEGEAWGVGARAHFGMCGYLACRKGVA